MITAVSLLRADHVGSLLRPPQLLEKMAQFAADQCSQEELKAAQDEAVATVVQLQQVAGIDIITNGEMERRQFHHGVFECMTGVTSMTRPIETCQPFVPYIRMFLAAGLKEYSTQYCTSKIIRTKGFRVEEFKFLKSIVPKEDVKRLKVTIVAPTWLHLRHGSNNTYDKSVYKNDAEYFADIAKVYREELEELYALGCRILQFDDPGFCFFCADSMIEGMEKAGVDPEATLRMYIKVYNDILKGRPADLTVGVHMCRGNYKGMHFCEGGYAPIAKILFNELDVDRFYLEFDNERAGGLEPLRHFPPGKTIVLGLITTKSGTMENVADVIARVQQAADIIAQGDVERSKEDALNQICLSPQCGFESAVDGNPITAEDQRNKLALVVEAARQIWG